MDNKNFDVALITSNIISYESGEMSEDEVFDFFQELIDSGLINHLQGHYGRTARDLLAAGHCVLPERARAE